MTCPVCGRYASADPETGYDADDLCPSCQADGWTEQASGELINVNVEDGGERDAEDL